MFLSGGISSGLGELAEAHSGWRPTAHADHRGDGQPIASMRSPQDMGRRDPNLSRKPQTPWKKQIVFEKRLNRMGNQPLELQYIYIYSADIGFPTVKKAAGLDSRTGMSFLKATLFWLVLKGQLKGSTTISGARGVLLGMDEILHHPRNNGEPLFVGIYRGISFPRFLRWCEVHSLLRHIYR